MHRDELIPGPTETLARRFDALFLENVADRLPTDPLDVLASQFAENSDVAGAGFAGDNV
ncbi:hypothetical protein CA54_05350 [Symmachiella macrocystis]|uniref:Uncharacterized protein n=1 Tax=Symmachiella macrocystis TaxID=2527985 RepID=A0A5C6BK80_9PLAN|nr:hypothetical protein [Symmachiella macrocystis]TWU11726.1 hypothetical protein CA54_05350 [Symmachiella macrocystis]